MIRTKLVIDEKLNCTICNECKSISFPAKDYCDKCQSPNTSQLLLGPRGKLLSYTISFIKPLMGNIKTPYPYGVGRFWNEEGDSIDILGLIDSREPFDDVQIDENIHVMNNKSLVKFKMEGK